MTKTPTHNTWAQMRQRCSDESCKDFERYGGRGIKVCARWQSFENFLEDMGERPKGMTLDRIDVNGSYEPGNCRWATPVEQSRNRRSNVFVTYGAATLTVAEWAERTGLERKTLEHRIRSGWDVERALTTKSITNRKRHHGSETYQQP